MNYGTSNAQPISSQELITESKFQTLVNQLGSYNDIATNLINQIEDKLHNILNRRQPTANEKNPDPKIGDLSDALQTQINKVDVNNYRLENILKHLSEII